jgi:hypothetical protein
MSQVLDELKLFNPSRAYPISLLDTDVLHLARKTTAPVSFSDLLGRNGFYPVSVIDFVPAGPTTNVSYEGNGVLSLELSCVVAWGSGSLSFAWSVQAAGGVGTYIVGSAGATTTVATSGQTAPAAGTAVVRCTVTDLITGVVSYADKTINWSWTTPAVTPFTITGFNPASPIFVGTVGAGVQSTSVQVLLANGSGNFSYAWSVYSNTAGGSLLNATSNPCAFNTGSFGAGSGVRETILSVVVTDNVTGRTQQEYVTIEWEWIA